MPLLKLVDRLWRHMRRWLGRPALPPPMPPALPNPSLADVELPPLIALGKGKRFHSPDCSFVQNPRGQIVPFRSRAEAHDRGLQPCQVCQPSTN